MRFHRPLGRISALTFDPDDILYDNRPVTTHTEQEVLAFAQNYHPALNSLQNSNLQRLRQAVHDAEPEIYHNVTQRRHHAVEHAMLEAGLSAAGARVGANTTMMNFAKWRGRIEVPQPTHDTLRALARRWPLVVVTNGNVQPELFGLDNYFEFVPRAGPDGRLEPFSDMYTLAAEELRMPVDEILHVGDDLTTDVVGAICCDMQVCRIKPGNAGLIQIANSRLLPHIEISWLAPLTSLIQSPAELCIYTQLFGGWRCANPPYLLSRGGANGRFSPVRQP